MTHLVEEEVERLSLKTDDELAKIYLEQHMSLFPMMVVVNALGVVMEQRKIKVKFHIGYKIEYE